MLSVSLKKKHGIPISRMIPKPFKSNARSKIKTKEAVGPLTDDDGEVILDDSVNVRLLNEYFAWVCLLKMSLVM